MKGKEMIAMTTETEINQEETEEKLGRFQQMRKDGREVEAFLARAELQEVGIWVN